jgi:hypothetical protein
MRSSEFEPSPLAAVSRARTRMTCINDSSSRDFVFWPGRSAQAVSSRLVAEAGEGKHTGLG